jgi:hypothetical protein
MIDQVLMVSTTDIPKYWCRPEPGDEAQPERPDHQSEERVDLELRDEQDDERDRRDGVEHRSVPSPVHTRCELPVSARFLAT